MSSTPPVFSLIEEASANGYISTFIEGQQAGEDRGSADRPDSKLLYRRAHRPREVDAGRPDARVHAYARPAGDARPGPGQQRAGARARDHDQAPRGADDVPGRGR